MRRRNFLALLPLLAAGLPPAETALPSEAQQAPTVVYLVRHAERAEDGTDDPPISEAGRARARLLADMLRDAGITAVHATDYRRTRSTAEPLAGLLGLRVRSYESEHPETFAADLAGSSGRHLVVGHSNTIPSLVDALGGDPGEPIETMEYDRLYVITLAGESASTVLIRFGARFEG